MNGPGKTGYPFGKKAWTLVLHLFKKIKYED